MLHLELPCTNSRRRPLHTVKITNVRKEAQPPSHQDGHSGQGRQTEPRRNGSQEHAWHCIPFSERAKYGIDLFYPFANELKVSTPDGSSLMVISVSGGRGHPPRQCGFIRTSSSGVSCCTCCPRASIASATTGSLPPPTAPTASPRPAHSWRSLHLPPIRNSSRMLHRMRRPCCRVHARVVALA